MPVLSVRESPGVYRDVGCGDSSTPGRLELTDGIERWIEVCDDDTGHLMPLQVEVAGVWTTVMCVRFVLTECTEEFNGSAGPIDGRTTTTGGLVWQALTGGSIGAGALLVDGSGHGVAAITTGPQEDDGVAVVHAGSPDCWIRLIIAAGEGYGGIFFRVVDADNWWQAYIHVYPPNEPFARMVHYVAGVGTEVFAVGLGFAADASAHDLAVHLNGDDIEFWRNGVLLVSTSSSLFNTATHHGIWTTTFAQGDPWPQLPVDHFAITKDAPDLAPNPVLVQEGYATYGTPSTSHPVSLPSATTPGNTLLVFVFEYPSANGLTTGMSGCGADWTKVGRVPIGSFAVSAWIGTNATGGSTVTATHSGLLQPALKIVEFSGVRGASQVDGHSGVASTAVSTGDLVPSVTGALLVGAICLNGTPSISWADLPGAWTALTNPDADFLTAYAIAGSVVTHEHTGTASSPVTHNGIIVELI